METSRHGVAYIRRYGQQQEKNENVGSGARGRCCMFFSSSRSAGRRRAYFTLDERGKAGYGTTALIREGLFSDWISAAVTDG